VRLLLLPGLHGTEGLFPPLERELPSWIAPTTINYPLDRLHRYDDVLRFILERAPEGHFAVLGDSYSGPLALMVARALPERVTAVILSVTFVTNPMRPMLRWARLFAYTPFVRIAPLRLVVPILINGTSPRERFERVMREIRSVAPRVLAARLREAIDSDHRADLVACGAPILYIKAANDRIISGRTLRVMKEIKPTIESVELPGPHALLLMNPAPPAAVIASFLSGVRE
jgi:pimeloyl-[acyl-carrier protein] methyl ester esterase